MKKAIIVVMLQIVLIAQGVQVNIDGITWDYSRITYNYGYSTYVMDAVEVSICGDDHPGRVVVPSSFGGYPVQKICGFSNITASEIVLPETTTGIKDGAFQNCKYLKKVNIPSGVSELHAYTFSGCTSLEQIVIPTKQSHIDEYTFYNCSSLKTVALPEGVMWIRENAFCGCKSLTSLEIPSSVHTVYANAFSGCTQLERLVFCGIIGEIPDYMACGCSALKELVWPLNVDRVGKYAFSGCPIEKLEFPESFEEVGESAFQGFSGEVIYHGNPPLGIENSGLLAASSVIFPREMGSRWMKLCGAGKFLGYLKTNDIDVCVTSSVRSDDPSVLDVVYKVKSDKPTVKVRAVAYIDGERSFSRIVRIENLVEGTEVNVGDAVSANEEHTISWKASEDLNVDLAKVKVEVLVVENELLPLEMIRIPAIGDRKAMELSWNVHTKEQLFDALLWLYADKTTGMTLTNGILSGDGKPFLAGTAFSHADDAIAFVFKQMGYSVLKGDALNYANKMTRLELAAPDASYGEKNYAYRWLEK